MISATSVMSLNPSPVMPDDEVLSSPNALLSCSCSSRPAASSCPPPSPLSMPCLAAPVSQHQRATSSPEPPFTPGTRLMAAKCTPSLPQ